jgi:hypothetical protein
MGLDYVEMVMEIEDRFTVEVPDADAGRLRTVGDWYWYLRDRLQARSGSSDDAPSGELWERLLDVIEKESGLPRERLRADADLSRDLGIS